MLPIDSINKTRTRNAKFFRPYGKGFSRSLVGDEASACPIVGLLRRGSPPNIECPVAIYAVIALAATVVLVIINAIQRLILRSWSNYAQEVRKVIEASTDANTAPAVSVKPFVVRVMNPASHFLPRGHFWGRVSMNRMSVLRSQFEFFFSETAARLNHAAKHRSSVGNVRGSAITKAVPVVSKVVACPRSMGEGDDGGAIKLATLEIFAVFRSGHLKPPTRFWNWSRSEWIRLTTALPILP